MKTLKEYAMILMAEGLTSVDEVLTNLVVSISCSCGLGRLDFNCKN